MREPCDRYEINARGFLLQRAEDLEGPSLGLLSVGLLLDVRIGSDAPTFKTAYFASLMFLIRDIVGGEATV
jgi:hypothetical protein